MLESECSGLTSRFWGSRFAVESWEAVSPAPPPRDSRPSKVAHHCTGLKGTPLSWLLPGAVKK